MALILTLIAFGILNMLIFLGVLAIIAKMENNHIDEKKFIGTVIIDSFNAVGKQVDLLVEAIKPIQEARKIPINKVEPKKIEPPPYESFLNTLQYAKDNIAVEEHEKIAIDSIITSVKKNYGGQDTKRTA